MNNNAKRNQLAKEVSKLASKANKRLKRLEKNGFKNVPSYRNFEKYGNGQKFSVKGKDYNELQKELSRVNHFLNSETSTVRGVTKNLKEIADNSGIKYTKTSELLEKTSQFFELSSKVEQYMKTVQGSYGAIGYQKVWENINTYVESEKLDLGNLDNLDGLIEEIGNMIEQQYEHNAMNEFDEWETLF